MKTTQEYFNRTTEDLQKVRNEYGYTKEECMLLDESEKTFFFSDLETLSRTEGLRWIQRQRYNIRLLLKMTDGRIAVLTD